MPGTPGTFYLPFNGWHFSTHAIATLVQLLRGDPDAYGLVTALGWYMTKHAAGIYSARPPRRAFASIDPQPRRPPPRRARTDYSGPAEIEAYTLAYQRDGAPDAAILSALTPDGDRALIRTCDRDVIDAILSDNPSGWSIDVAGEERLTIERPMPGSPR